VRRDAYVLIDHIGGLVGSHTRLLLAGKDQEGRDNDQKHKPSQSAQVHGKPSRKNAKIVARIGQEVKKFAADAKKVGKSIEMAVEI
jgi:hypothetical protein